MKYTLLFLFLPILIHPGSKIQNQNGCSLLVGIYINTNGEHWRLSVVNQSSHNFYLLACDENNCDDASEEYTFTIRDCDGNPHNGAYQLCSSEKSKNIQLTFTNCNNISCDAQSNETHFKQVTLKIKENTKWTATYSCDDN